MMIKRKNYLDEMQEQKLLRIEHNGVWLAFWGLLAAILIQEMIGMSNGFENIIGEFIVFIILDIYLLMDCLRNNIWDRHLQPTAKTNLIISLISSVTLGLFYFITSYLKYEKLLGSIATGVFILISVFILTFVCLSVCASIHKKRVKKLEEYSDLHSDNSN